ncbi:Mitochondrial import receptor subunit tom40 [Penicillium verhagenii]|nr:Mitochondrial import receptor subunit tom40 [Penicillium verhagenii]
MSDITSSLSFLTENPAAAAIKDAYTSFSDRRALLNLPNPGTVDGLAREVQKDVLLTNFMFTGLRADLTKVFGMSPLFRVSHAFAMGGSGNMPPYNFSTMPSTPSTLEGGLTGIFVGSYLQSITPGLALGFEAIWQRQGMNARPETALSYCAKYKGDDWIGTAQLQAQGTFAATYWRKLSERVEAGVDMNLQFAPSAAAMMMGGPSREGTTAIGAKYDFRASSFRAQVDSAGKVSCLLEKRIAMPISLSFAGEIDQAKQTAKVGLAVSLEIAGEELMEQQETADAASMIPPLLSKLPDPPSPIPLGLVCRTHVPPELITFHPLF